jgi:hypothetical protein
MVDVSAAQQRSTVPAYCYVMHQQHANFDVGVVARLRIGMNESVIALSDPISLQTSS